MKYLVALMIWSLVNMPITFIAYKHDVNFEFSLIYFIGLFILIIYGIVETRIKLNSINYKSVIDKKD